jgi:hypothetical protein
MILGKAEKDRLLGIDSALSLTMEENIPSETILTMETRWSIMTCCT